MAEKKKMSVAEILAAARKSDSAGGAAPAEAPASETPAAAAQAAPPETAAEPKAAPAKPAAAKPAAKPADGARMSVAEMMAAARAEKQGGAPAEAKPAAPAKKEAPAAKPAAAVAAAPKASPKPAAAPVASAPKDTGSILADARTTAKPGPMSKAEAALKAPAAKPAAQCGEAAHSGAADAGQARVCQAETGAGGNRRKPSRFSDRRWCWDRSWESVFLRWPRRWVCGRWARRGSCSPTC